MIGWLTSKEWASEEQCESGLVGLWDEVAERHFPAFRAREVTFQEQRRRRLREFLPYLGVPAEQLSEAALDLIFQDYLEHYEAAWCAYEDVLPCLAALSGVRVAVLSNGDQAQQEDKLRRTGLHQCFEVVMASSALGAAKPSPEAFTLACERLAVDPATATYVGDRLDVDAEAAAAAGLRGVWLDRRGGHDRGYKADDQLAPRPPRRPRLNAGSRQRWSAGTLLFSLLPRDLHPAGPVQQRTSAGQTGSMA